MASFYHIYNRSIEKTHRIGARQKNASMFPDQFKIEGCTINPALIRWPFGQWRNYSKQSIESMGLPSSPTFLVTYCQGHFCFFQIYQRFQGVGWRSVKKPDILEVLIPEQSNKRARFNRALSPELDGPFVWGDMRFYFDEMNQTRTIYYVKDHKRRHSPFVPWTDVFVYDKGIDSFHTGSRGNKLDISNHTRPQQEKNWSPFTYNSTSFFVYSISPVHRIVGTASRGFEPGNEQGQDVVFAYETPNEVQWDWGELRGGTPAEIISTEDGPKFISFAHSQKRVHHRAIKTYFVAAYLFEPQPPFKVTHITREPLVPQGVFYNQSATGWAWSNLDYVAFPMGMGIVDQHTLVLSLGVNDRECHAVEVNITALLADMRRV